MRTLLKRTGAIAAIALLYFSWPMAWPDLLSLNADDSEAYVILSWSLSHGAGYTRNLPPADYIPHLTWPPAMPVLLYPALAWQHLPLDWLPVKLWCISLALLGVLFAWLLVRQRTGQAFCADLAALAIALSPSYWLLGHTALTEIPSVTFALGVVLLSGRVWRAAPPRPIAAFGLGVFAGLGMLLRGTLLGLILLPFAQDGAIERLRRREPAFFRAAAAQVFGFILPDLAWSLRGQQFDRHGLGGDGINQFRMLLTSGPVDPDSALRTPGTILIDSFHNIIHFIVYNIPRFVLPGIGLTQWQLVDGMVVPAALLTAVIGLLVLRGAFREARLFWVAAVWVGVLLVYATGGSARFWVPLGALFLVLTVIGLADPLAQLSPVWRRALLGGIVLAYGASTGVTIARQQVHPYLAPLDGMMALFTQVAPELPQDSQVLAPHCALFVLTTGRSAPLTYEARGILPRYTHVIFNHGQMLNFYIGRPQAAIAESKLVTAGSGIVLRSVDGWDLVKLTHPMNWLELSAVADAPKPPME